MNLLIPLISLCVLVIVLVCSNVSLLKTVKHYKKVCAIHKETIKVQVETIATLNRTVDIQGRIIEKEKKNG